MRKNDPNITSPRSQAVVVRGILALVVVGLLVVPIAVQAELKATSLAYTWDLSSNEWEWGHATVMFDGGWIPLLQEVYFDGLGDRVPGEEEPQVCADGLTTLYAGWIEYGLPYRDADPKDARGFEASRDWVLIDCDLNGDGTWDRDDLTVNPGDIGPPLAICSPGGEHCDIRYQDQVQSPPAATSEHCEEELATQLIISLDSECDGTVDPGAAHLYDVAETTGLCVYSWARTPAYLAGEEWWTFPLPVRITDADGAKTLMLYPVPNAVELASFNAKPQGRDVLVSWETASEIDNVGFNIYRSKAGGERIRLNDWLIPSQSPGSTAGSSYQFVDRSAEPDTAYQYWLEDIDAAGAAGMNGPLAVQMPRYRSLPCRPRPAPIPQIQ
jgi:hypothetical protein